MQEAPVVAEPAAPEKEAPKREEGRQGRPVKKAIHNKKGPGPRPRMENHAVEGVKSDESGETDPTANIAAAIIQTLEASENNGDQAQAPETSLQQERPRHQHQPKKEPAFYS